MSLPPPTSLPPRAPDDLRVAYDEAISARALATRKEIELRSARHQAKQLITRYENLLLEHIGQLRFDLEDTDA